MMQNFPDPLMEKMVVQVDLYNVWQVVRVLRLQCSVMKWDGWCVSIRDWCLHDGGMPKLLTTSVELMTYSL